MRGVVTVTIVGEAFIRIRPDDAGFSNEAEKGILSKIGGIATKAAGVFATGFAVKQGIDFFGGLIADASESRRVLAETEQAIKATGGAANVSAGQISDLADSLSKKTGIDDEAIQTGENLLLTFKNIRNETGKGNDIFNQATAAVLDLSKQFGGIEASSVQVGKALNDPIAGVTALTRVGIQFTEAQKDQIKALVETGDTLGAQKIILGEINAQVGGQAAAQATAADRLRVVWGNLREELGARLLPIVDKVATFLADRLPGALDKVGSVLGPVFRGIRQGIDFLIAGFKSPDAMQAPESFLDVLFNVGGRIKLTIDKIKDVVSGLFDFIVKGDFTGAFARAFHVEEDSPIVNVLFRVRDAFFQLVAFVKDNVQPILLAVGAAFLIAAGPVVAIGTALVLLYTRFQVVRDVIGAVAAFLTETVVPAIAAFVGFVTEQFSNLADFVRENWAGIQEAITHVVNVVQAVIENFVAVVGAIWRAWGDELLNIVGIVWDQIRNIVETAVDIISGVIRAGVALINGDWGQAWDAIKDILSAAWEYIRETVVNALRILREVVEGGISAVVAVVGDLPGQVVDKLESLVGFMADVGERAVRAMASAIGGAIGWVLDAAGSLVSKVKDKLTFWDSPPETFGLHVGQRLVGGIAEGLSESARAESAARKLVGAVKSQFSDLGTAGPDGQWQWERNAFGQMERIYYPPGHKITQPAVGSSSSGAGVSPTTVPFSGTLIGQLVINAPSGDAPAIGAAVRQAVTQLVADGTVGRAMSKRSQTYATR